MPRKPVFPPKIKRHVSGRAYCRWKGRTYYLGEFGSPGVQDRHDRLCAELASGIEPRAARSGSVTVAEIVTRFMAASKRPAHEQQQFGRSLKPLLSLFTSLPAAEFGPKKLRDVQAEMIRLGWSRGVINRRMTRIRTCWRWAESEELVPRGSWESLRTVPSLGKQDGVRSTRPRAPVHMDKIRLILPYLGAVYRDMLLLQYWSGMRPSEARELRAEWLDRSQPIWTYRPDGHKSDWREGDTGRVVLLGPKCQAVLRKRLVGKTKGLAFPTRKGTAVAPTNYSMAVYRACERAGIRPFCPYQMRHSAKQRVTRLHGLDAARAFLGQKSLGTTNLYAAEQDEQLARRAAS